MKMIRRMTTSISSRLDAMVTQIENQEALVTSTIREARQAIARARVHRQRVHQDGEALQQRLEQEQEGTSQWRTRARQCADQDEAKAIECLRRSRRAGNMTGELQRRLDEHRRVEKKLASDLKRMEDQLAELIEKRNLMRTRQSRAEAMSAMRSATTKAVSDLGEVFERWETRVLETEYEGACAFEEDPLSEEFLSAEEEAELKDELERIKQAEVARGQEHGPADPERKG